jgi:hypothetical protein
MHRSKIELLDHLVGTCEHGRWNVEAERLGSGEIDNHIELGRLLYRDIRRIPGTTFPSAPPSCRSRCRRKFARRRMSDSLRLNAGRLNDRPPFLDLCLMKCADSVCGPQVRGRKLQTSIG